MNSLLLQPIFLKLSFTKNLHPTMRVRFLTCFIFVLCAQAISSLCLHRNFSSEQRDLNSSKSNMQTNQPIRNYGGIKEAIGSHREDEESKYELSCDSIKKAQRGKGANGGANVNYRTEPRRSVNSAPSLLPRRISTLCVSLILILIFC